MEQTGTTGAGVRRGVIAGVCAIGLAAMAPLALGDDGSRDADRSLPLATIIDFDGSLPPGATLTRASVRLDAEGNLVAVDTPRFATSFVTPGARLVASLPTTQRVIGVGAFGGAEHAVVTFGSLDIGLVDAMYGAEGPPEVLAPHRSVEGKLGGEGSVWGTPKTAEIYPDGTLVIHTAGASAERRGYTVRTNLLTFDRVESWSVARVSDYAPPEATPAPFVTPVFTRLTYLPNLDIWASGIAEYRTPGPVSSLDPKDGRSLGYASSDGGQTWVRVIDTDDPALGRDLVDSAKHLHHVEPFEWWDDVNQRWNVGAVGCLGDGDSSALIWVRSPTPDFPPEGQNHLMQATRTKAYAARALTDLFSLDPSDEGAGGEMRFLQGQDSEMAGIFDLIVSEGVETNRALFRPVIPYQWREFAPNRVQLPIYPYIFQMDRLAHGGIVASLNDGRNDIDPNGFWASDPSGEHWATAWLIDELGYQGVMPVGPDRFWTIGLVGIPTDKISTSELWELAPGEVRDGLMLGAAAPGVWDFPWFGARPDLLIEDVTGVIPPPEELAASTPVKRMFSETMAANTWFARADVEAPGAQPGDLVSVRYWIRNARPETGVARIENFYRTVYADATSSFDDSLSLTPETTEWIPVTIVRRWPDEPIQFVEIISALIGDADAGRPIDYYFTEPRVVLHTQAAEQETNSAGAATAADRLEVSLPALGSAWTVAVWATEAPGYALSLLDGAGDGVSLVPAPGPDGLIYNGVDQRLSVERWSGGSPASSQETGEIDIVVPTQNLVVFRRDAGSSATDVWVSRGMGELEEVVVEGAPAAPTRLLFASPDEAVSFEGLVHRVAVWEDEALADSEIETLRTQPLAPATAAPCAGDVDGDGDVDVRDFAALAEAFGRRGVDRSRGDLDGDADVDVRDFAILAEDFGCRR